MPTRDFFSADSPHDQELQDLKPSKLHYVLFYKPYGVLSQFTGAAGQRTLGDFGPFPRDVYPVGRLDADSEGVLLLTNDNELKHRLLHPRYGHRRTYLVQVERRPSDEALSRIREGVIVEGRRTQPAEVELLRQEPALPPRSRPIRFRKSVPTSWLRITLTEGRNRQVRKMTASVGHPTLRIVRISIGPFSISGLGVGESRELAQGEMVRIARLLETSRRTSRFRKSAQTPPSSRTTPRANL